MTESVILLLIHLLTLLDDDKNETANDLIIQLNSK